LTSTPPSRFAKDVTAPDSHLSWSAKQKYNQTLAIDQYE
jgi:hypothetical protein